MKKKLVAVSLIILAVITAFSVTVGKNYSNACDTYAQNGVKAELTFMIYDIASEYLSTFNEDKKHFTEIKRKSDGTVSDISIDTIKLNILAAELSNRMYETIEYKCPEFGIPFGNLTGFKSLSGKGFKLPVKAVPVGCVAFESQSEFISGGINQILHRISIIFSVTVNCLTPFHECNSVITVPVIVSETVINGNVPNHIWKK